MARLAAGELFHIVNDHLGTPKEMFLEGGDFAWSVDHDTWGKVRRVDGAKRAVESGDYWVENVAYDPGAQAEPTAMLCPIRFQGQWEDAETGLYYNRFRYYEPLAGQYMSSDPIGFAAGPQNYSYVGVPTNLIDPWGLETLYRNLKFDEYPCSQGRIFPKAFDHKHITPERRVLSGSRSNFCGSQYISTTRDIEVARKYREFGRKAIAIDGDMIDAEK